VEVVDSGEVPQEEEVVETAEVVETEAVTRGVETGTVPAVET